MLSKKIFVSSYLFAFGCFFMNSICYSKNSLKYHSSWKASARRKRQDFIAKVVIFTGIVGINGAVSYLFIRRKKNEYERFMAQLGKQIEIKRNTKTKKIDIEETQKQFIKKNMHNFQEALTASL